METDGVAKSGSQNPLAKGRNIIVCCDGTNNQFGAENTNVVRLIQVLDRSPGKQRLYYDPGVGTLPEPGVVTWLGKKISDIFGLAFGAGLTWKVQEAYTYLMRVWQPGDDVYLFGFSRGAYSARVLAGLLHAVGLLPRGNENLVPYAMRLYQGVRNERQATNAMQGQWAQLCNDFRWTFSRQAFDGDDARHFPVHFLGLWDTVSSVGWVWDPLRFPFTASNPSVATIRHAVSLDERRWFFRQNLIKHVAEPVTKTKGDQNLEEHWFPGVHCDVGGGYPNLVTKNPETYSSLWRAAFDWMLEEARKAGLLIDESRLKQVLEKDKASPRPWLDPKRESLTLSWWPAEFFPKYVWSTKLKKNKLAVGCGRHRRVEEGAKIGKAALLRLRQSTDYQPPNLSTAFRESVLALKEVPDFLPYKENKYIEQF